MTNTIAQTSLNSSGGDESTRQGSIAFTVGQIFIESSDFSHIEPGVQHAFEVLVLNNQETPRTKSINVFPNPASESLSIKLAYSDDQRLSYDIYNLRGVLILTDKIKNDVTCVNISTLPNGIYILHLIENNSCIEKFKLIIYL